MPGINIIRKMTNIGTATGIPKPNGIKNYTEITVANPINIDTIISTIAPTADLNVSYIPNNVNILAVITPCVLFIVSFTFIRIV